MAILRIIVNDREVVRAGGERFCSLHWDVRASLFEAQVAALDVSGLLERKASIYDAAYWLESYPLEVGDRVAIQCEFSEDPTEPVRWHTQEEREALRLEVARAEAAGEYDAARAERPLPQRTRAKLHLVTPRGSRTAVAGVNGETVVCSGAWSNDHRTGEWLVRLTGYGTNATKGKGEWLPIDGGVIIEIAA